MRFQDLVMEFDAPGVTPGAPQAGAPAAPGAAPQPGAAAQPGAAPATPDPQAAAKMQAQQALDRQNQKKQVMDEIKQTQEQIVELQKTLQDKQKQLATLK